MGAIETARFWDQFAKIIYNIKDIKEENEGCPVTEDWPASYLSEENEQGRTMLKTVKEQVRWAAHLTVGVEEERERWCHDGIFRRGLGRSWDFLDCDVTGWRTRLQSWPLTARSGPAWSLSHWWCYYSVRPAVPHTVWLWLELLVCLLLGVRN